MSIKKICSFCAYYTDKPKMRIEKSFNKGWGFLWPNAMSCTFEAWNQWGILCHSCRRELSNWGWWATTFSLAYLKRVHLGRTCWLIHSKDRQLFTCWVWRVVALSSMRISSLSLYPLIEMPSAIFIRPRFSLDANCQVVH